ncbi:MAG: exopolysaccharide Pel transporter PelG, partial [Clostridia bacterium]
SLIWIGFFGILGAFIHMILMWYSDELGSVISGWLRHAPAYDAASFYAFLVSLPTMINFVVSVEVNFYTRYRKYFDAITNGGSLAEIELARTEMIAVLKQEVFQLAQVQVFALIIYMVLMKYYLVTIGFTHDMLSMFRILCVGYSAYAVGNSLMLLQLYFDDRKGAMVTVWTFFIANLLLTAYVRNQASLLYGSGMLIAGCLMYAVGLIRLMHYVREIDYHVYCGQPVLAVVRISHWETLSQWLDARALRKSAPSIPTKEEIHT